MPFSQLEGIDSVSRLQYGVAAPPENVSGQTPDGFLVLDQQHGSRAARYVPGGGGAPPDGGPPPRVTVERTGETATVAGQPARKYRVLADGQPYQVGAGVPGAAGQPRRSVHESQEYLAIFRDGWPVKIVSYDGGAGRTVSEVTLVEPHDVADAEFAPPAGFREAPLLEVMGAR